MLWKSNKTIVTAIIVCMVLPLLTPGIGHIGCGKTSSRTGSSIIYYICRCVSPRACFTRETKPSSVTKAVNFKWIPSGINTTIVHTWVWNFKYFTCSLTSQVRCFSWSACICCSITGKRCRWILDTNLKLYKKFFKMKVN